jgi:nucleoside-diphosphate-sugar epimerase
VTWISFAKTQVDAFFLQVRPEAVFVAAAKVGGIYANVTYPADFLYDNLLIAREGLGFIRGSCYPHIQSPLPTRVFWCDRRPDR